MACPISSNVTSKFCNVTDVATGYTFNLEPLRAHRHIYTVNDTLTNSQYFVTVCDFFKKEESHCGTDGIAGCQIDSHNNSHVTGQYSSMTLSYQEGSITLLYSGGEPCSTGNRTTEIDFVCDRSARDDYFGYPKSVNEPKHCHYLFTWSTALACLPITLDCVADGGAYDLRPLMQTRNWNVDTSKGKAVLSVCQPVSDSVRCPHSFGVGACIGSTVLGYVTGDLIVISDGVLQLSYHNGDTCSDSGLRKITVITFHCNRRAGAVSKMIQKLFL